MSKSTGNIVPINSGAEDMYGKVMSVPDFAMGTYSRLVSRWTPSEIEEMEEAVKSGELHPRDAKMKLAHEIVSIFYSTEEALDAEESFVRLFQQKETPDDMPEYQMEEGATVMDVLMGAGLMSSKSEARRMIDQKAVRLDGETLERSDESFPHPGVLQVGKRRFVRVR
jgi:tyrosyl-tRNA synthetase